MPRSLSVSDDFVTSTTKTHCPYCAFQCGMSVTPVHPDSESLEVAADPEFPVNRGQMCIKGFTSAALLLARKIGWKPILWTGFSLWALAQFGLRADAYKVASKVIPAHIPLNEMGAFDLLAIPVDRGRLAGRSLGAK